MLMNTVATTSQSLSKIRYAAALIAKNILTYREKGTADL
jgi:hypothetical protein